jgi:hypothetical protein
MATEDFLTYKVLPLVSGPDYFCPVPPTLFKTYFNIMLPSTLTSKGSSKAFYSILVSSC